MQEKNKIQDMIQSLTGIIITLGVILWIGMVYLVTVWADFLGLGIYLAVSASVVVYYRYKLIKRLQQHD